MHNLISKAVESHSLDAGELLEILKNDDVNPELFAAADKVRKKFVGDKVLLRGLIEFSNICRNNCCYCGLRRDNRKLERYRMSPDEIVYLATDAVLNQGFQTIVLQSGEDLWFTQDILCDIIRRIKKTGCALTLSIGEKSAAEYQAYRDAGADRFLLRIETSDQALYEKYDPDMSWEKRVQCLYDLKDAGFELGCGCLVGLPGQTIESLANDVLFFKKIRADMIGIGPLIVHPDTPLNGNPNGSFTLALKVMALTRLLMPQINIPATTAMEALVKGGREMALNSGANVYMPKVTPLNLQNLYQLYRK